MEDDGIWVAQRIDALVRQNRPLVNKLLSLDNVQTKAVQTTSSFHEEAQTRDVGDVEEDHEESEASDVEANEKSDMNDFFFSFYIAR